MFIIYFLAVDSVSNTGIYMVLSNKISCYGLQYFIKFWTVHVKGIILVA